MAIRALTIDLSGTIVREDHDVMMTLCRAIAESSSRMLVPADAAKYLWEYTHEYYLRDYRAQTFVSARRLEEEALRQTLRAADSSGDFRAFSEIMRGASGKPELFPDARAFFIQLPLPCLIVTNGDRKDLESTLAQAHLSHVPFVCSEDVGAYKPRPEIFGAAVQMLNLRAEEVLHIGDSLIYDVEPAQALGMKTAWLNRTRKPLSGGIRPDVVINNLMDLKKLMHQDGRR